MYVIRCAASARVASRAFPRRVHGVGSKGQRKPVLSPYKLPTSRPPSLHTLVVTLTVENKFEVFDLQSFISILRCQSQFPGTAVSPLAATDCNLNFEIECQSKTFKFRT